MPVPNKLVGGQVEMAFNQRDFRKDKAKSVVSLSPT